MLMHCEFSGMMATVNKKDDMYESLSEAVEGGPGASARVPKEPTPADSAQELSEENIDRSVILSSDARSLAGWALRLIVTAAAAWVVWKALGFIWVGLLPAILALIFSTVLWPPVRFLRTRKVPAALAVILVIVAFFGAIIAIFATMAPTISSQAQDLYTQAQRGVDQVLNWIENGPLGIDTTQIDDALAQLRNFLTSQASDIASGVITGVGVATDIVVTLVLMLVLTFFFLKDGDRFLPWVRQYVGAKAGFHITEVSMRSWNTLSGFIRTQAVVSFVDALFIGIGLVILQVPLALALAVITFFAGFIPIVGAFTAGALAVVIALVSQGFWVSVAVLVLIIVVQQVEGNVLQPILQSKAMGLHAAMVLLSVTVGSTLFGIIGAFLAVPVAAVVAVWFRYHAEMVSLRTGEITADDIKIATQQGATMSSRQAFEALRNNLRKMGRRASKESGEQPVDPGYGATSVNKLREGGDAAAANEIHKSPGREN